MQEIKARFAGWSQNKAMKRLVMGGAGALLLLIVCLCMSIFMQFHMHHRCGATVDRMQEQTYQGLVTMTELYARVDDPGVDVQNKLIPEMKAAYTGVSALNAALTENFGADDAVLTVEQTAAFDAAFDEYSAAYRQGLETGLARADMELCIQQVQAMIDERYAPDVEPTEPVVVIDGNSGEIANG